MQRLDAPGRTELRQSNADMLALPGLVAVALVAIVIRQLFVHPPSVVTLVVCGVAAVLDIPLGWFFLRNGAATLIVTAHDVTFSRPGNKHTPIQTLTRVPDSKLSFRVQSNGFVGGQPQYLLKLCDQATGKEIPASAFGRSRVRRACESQGWTFA